MKQLVYILVVITLFISCEKEVQIDLPDVPVELVVEGVVDIDRPPIVVLTKTQGYFDPVDATTINNLFCLLYTSPSPRD